jgi:hypothetical protein
MERVMTTIYVGYDEKDDLAAKVCIESLKKHSKGHTIHLLKDHEVRKDSLYRREFITSTSPSGGVQYTDMGDGKPFSTHFAFTRFLVPALERFDSEQAVFVDADFMFRAPIEEMLEQVNKKKAVSCVQHNHTPIEDRKMDGVIQTRYHRKNWSSLMVFNPDLCRTLTPYRVNISPGSWLHAICWAQDDEIGSIDEAWNWLDGWSSDEIEPKAVHYTNGTPDMITGSAYADEWWEYTK